jgi:hypothetical protein
VTALPSLSGPCPSAHDVLVVELRHRLRFAEQSSTRRARAFVETGPGDEELHRDLALERLVERGVDDSGASGAELLEDDVPPQRRPLADRLVLGGADTGGAF